MNPRLRPLARRRAAPFASVALAALAAASLLFGCARSKSWIERRRDTFVQIAALVNEPIQSLRPYHARIMPSAASISLVDAQLDACFEAAPRVEAIERAPLPPDDQGKPIPSAEALTRAAESFRTGLGECKAGLGSDQGRGDRVSRCLLRCMKDWSQILRSVEHVRRDADWVGVRVESIVYIKMEENGQ
jgi:hypothetical protein